MTKSELLKIRGLQADHKSVDPHLIPIRMRCEKEWRVRKEKTVLDIQDLAEIFG